MERVLGLRAEAKQIHWAVVDGTRRVPKIIAYDAAAAPVNLEEAPALSWYSDRAKLILKTYSPVAAAVRTAESIARTNNTGARRRLRIEGALLQTMDSCGLKVTVGALAMISGKLGGQAKQYITSGEFRGLDLLKIQLPAREAVLVAVALLPEE